MTKLLIQLNRVTLLRKLEGYASGLDGALLITEEAPSLSPRVFHGRTRVPLPG